MPPQRHRQALAVRSPDPKKPREFGTVLSMERFDDPLEEFAESM